MNAIVAAKATVPVAVMEALQRFRPDTIDVDLAEIDVVDRTHDFREIIREEIGGQTIAAGLSGQARQILDDSILLQALRQLENDAVHIAEVVVDRFPGRSIPNSWGSDFVSSALRSPLAHAISTSPQTVGIGEDKNGQLLVSAAMSRVLAFCAPHDEISRGRGRISILGHDVYDIRHS